MYILLFIILLIFIVIGTNKIKEGYENKITKVGIVSMIKKPHHIITWIKYHLQIGIDKLYIFIDDPDDYSIKLIKNYPENNKIKMVIIDSKWLEDNKYIKDNSKDEPLNWNVRQDLCVNNALKYSQEDGIDILIHIDCDELLYSQNNKKLNYIFNSKKGNTFKIKNYEIAPDRDNYENCFLENRYFRKNGKRYIAYGNGKGGGRVGKVKSNGPHEMINLYGTTDHHNIDEKDLIVLHYVSCNINETIKKYKLYSNFSNKNWEWATHHLESRDKLVNCIDDCSNKAKELFKKRMKSNEDDIIEININNLIS